MDDDKKPLRGEELSRLYFRQKTTEQRLEDDKRLAKMQLARRPRQPRLRVALYGSGLVGLIVLLISKVPALWETGSTPGISFTFLAWIVLGFGAIQWIKYASQVFYAYEELPGLFLAVFFMLSLTLGAVWLNGLVGRAGDMWLVGLCVVHFAAVFVSLKLLLQVREG